MTPTYSRYDDHARKARQLTEHTDKHGAPYYEKVQGIIKKNMSKYNQELPVEVEAQLDAYIERIKAIKWLQPSPYLKREDIDRRVNVALEAFGMKASIEYRQLKTAKDWGAALDAALDAAWSAARGAAWDAARDAAWSAARGAAWRAARGAAWDAAWDAALDAALDAARGAGDVLVLNTEEYRKKYPNGNFINLIPIWEAGLYPIGVVDGKFIVYVPSSSGEYPKELV